MFMPGEFDDPEDQHPNPNFQNNNGLEEDKQATSVPTYSTTLIVHLAGLTEMGTAGACLQAEERDTRAKGQFTEREIRENAGNRRSSEMAGLVSHVLQSRIYTVAVWSSRFTCSKGLVSNRCEHNG